MPVGLDTNKAEASFENGVLTLTTPKSEEVKPKQIKIKARGAIEGKKEERRGEERRGEERRGKEISRLS